MLWQAGSIKPSRKKEGNRPLQATPTVTLLFLPGFTSSITFSHKPISALISCHTMTLSPPRSPTSEHMRSKGT